MKHLLLLLLVPLAAFLFGIWLDSPVGGFLVVLFSFTLLIPYAGKRAASFLTSFVSGLCELF